MSSSVSGTRQTHCYNLYFSVVGSTASTSRLILGSKLDYHADVRDEEI